MGNIKKDGMQLLSSSGQSSFFLVSDASPAPPACPGKSLGGAGEGVPKMLPVVGSSADSVCLSPGKRMSHSIMNTVIQPATGKGEVMLELVRLREESVCKGSLSRWPALLQICW